MAKLRYSKNSLCGRRSIGDHLIISPFSFHFLQTYIQDHHQESVHPWGDTSSLYNSSCHWHHHRDKPSLSNLCCYLHSALLVHSHHLTIERSMEVSIARYLWLFCYFVFAHMLCRVHGMGWIQTLQRNLGRCGTVCIYSWLYLESAHRTQYC